jgi:hypothetical protein
MSLPMPGLRPIRSTTPRALNSSVLENDGERRTSGPSKPWLNATSIAMFAPRLCPTTIRQPSRAARSLESRANDSIETSGGAARPAKPGGVTATSRTGGLVRAACTSTSS